MSVAKTTHCGRVRQETVGGKQNRTILQHKTLESCRPLNVPHVGSCIFEHLPAKLKSPGQSRAGRDGSILGRRECGHRHNHGGINLLKLKEDFVSAAGARDGTVEVEVSYDIIRQFSMQLYSNPRKAIEELICNSYDAGATECHVKTPRDAHDFLAVLDNGESMDLNGLQDLWKVALSPKEGLGSDRVDNNRQQIGKFGVGKLATFSLGRRLTHVAMKGGNVRLVSVGQSEIKDLSGGSKPTFEVYKLSEKEARAILEPHLGGLPKPWEQKWKSWTLAIVSEIDQDAAGRALRVGILRRMITHALPLSARFEVHLDGKAVEKRQLKKKNIVLKVEVTDRKFKDHVETSLQHYWQKRLELDDLEDVPDDLYKCSIGEMPNPEKVDEEIPALIVPKAGPISGHAIIANITLTPAKLVERGYRDNGFAVYARGRQINPEDELFGITQRTHMYWRRFRADVEIPSLDKVLLVQRNSVSENYDETLVAREVLRVLFEDARVRAEAEEEVEGYVPEPFGARLNVLSPFIGPLALRGLAGDKFPEGGIKAVDVDFATLGEGGPASTYDTETSSILINDEHPIMVAVDELGKPAKEVRRVIGEVIAGTLMASGYLKARGVEEGLVQEAQDIVDDSLRSAAGYLVDAVDHHAKEIEETSYEGDKPFEKAIVAAFRNFRLSAKRSGGPGKDDAVIVIPQAASKNLRISVEAKGGKGIVTHKDVSASTIERHMEDHDCTKAMVVARQFQTKGKGKEDSALIQEMRPKFPLITTAGIVKMLHLHAKRPFTNDKVEQILTTWTHPDELENFVDFVWRELPELGLMGDVLKVAWEMQDVDEKNFPDPGTVVANPRIRKRKVTREQVGHIIEVVQISTNMVLILNPATHEFKMLSPPETILEALSKLPEEPNEEPQEE